ncbi:MAG: hypothetical protein H0X38_10235 [Planctomycetes bacterium]|nr:hypothetical protein [Planctomycetota bacterium]
MSATPASAHAVEPAAPASIIAAQPFLLFGMGARRKLLMRGDELLDARTGQALRRWPGAKAVIDPAGPTVVLTLPGDHGGTVTISEDAAGVWLQEGGERSALSMAPVTLPTFLEGGRDPARAALLRVLHHEILLNIVDGQPLPNFMVYHKPWYRDGAMMAMVLAKTGNIGLIAEWIKDIRDPYDHNNAGRREPDNLGQVLYLISLVSDAHHPVVATVLTEAETWRKGDHILGTSDFAEHPVYQTKWLKYGLRALSLPDPWIIPAVADSYSCLFWMDYRDQHVGNAGFSDVAYPYLMWAAGHFYGKLPAAPKLGFPLSWEAAASQADYAGMTKVSAVYAQARLAAPHTWHAAEMFLALSE